ncbi:MAG: hypothetical protein ACREBY_04140 [Polaromonas sp.]
MDRSPPASAKAGISTALKVVVVVLAIIGGIAVLAALAMGWMHFSMMGGIGRC